MLCTAAAKVQKASHNRTVRFSEEVIEHILEPSWGKYAGMVKSTVLVLPVCCNLAVFRLSNHTFEPPLFKHAFLVSNLIIFEW